MHYTVFFSNTFTLFCVIYVYIETFHYDLLQLAYHDLLLLMVKSSGSSRTGGGSRGIIGMEWLCGWYLKYSDCLAIKDENNADNLYIFSMSATGSGTVNFNGGTFWGQLLPLLLCFSLLLLLVLLLRLLLLWLLLLLFSISLTFPVFEPFIHFLELTWLEKEPECVKRRPQCLHSNGFSPEWMRKCSFKWCLNLKAFSHWLHLKRRNVSELSCVSMCRCNR